MRLLTAILGLLLALPAWADISFVSGTVEDSATAGDLTIGVPAGTQDGDVMFLCYLSVDATDTSDVSVSGWVDTTDLVLSTAGFDTAARVFHRVASSEPSTYDVDNTGAVQNRAVASIMTLRGVDTSTPLDEAYVEGSHYVKRENDATPLPQPIDTNSDGAWVAICAGANATSSITNIIEPSGYTERTQNIATQRFMQWSTKEVASSGTETPGDVSYTGSDGSEETVLFTLAIKPASSGPEFSSGPAISGTTDGFSLAKWPKAGEWINYEGSVFGPNGLLRYADRGEAILAQILGDKYRSITAEYQFRKFEYTDLVLLPPGTGDCLEGFIPEGTRLYVVMGEQPEPGDLVLVRFSERTRATFNWFAERGYPGVPYTPPDGYSVKIYYRMQGREILANALQATTLADNEIVGVVRYADINGALAYMAAGDPGPRPRP